jgi:hypothetical protein
MLTTLYYTFGQLWWVFNLIPTMITPNISAIYLLKILRRKHIGMINQILETWNLKINCVETIYTMAFVGTMISVNSRME